jgi:cellulose synthase/poly-beta-1,6-N-acetylglucosamine synthase-like glycosyltransferase
MIATNYVGLAPGNLIFALVSFTAAVALLLIGRTLVGRSPQLRTLSMLAVSALAGTATWLALHPGWVLSISILFGLMLPVVASRMLKGFSLTGSFLMAARANVTLSGLMWGLSVIVTAPVGPVTRTLISVTFALAALSLSVGLIQSFEQWEVVCRREWRRPRVPAAGAPRMQYPKVSLHVPTYVEPPELVIATLNALANLRYPNFEVLVIDNNTPDPALWCPVEAHCRMLGERFRFFHVDRLAGAKAGALNFALRHTAPDADLIGVIDSDYEVNPDFLAALVGYFDDPHMGFVQTPQAYRDWSSSPYQRMCNWEYKLVFATTLVSRNERMAAITVGTMGLIRRRVLDHVGGWAEWCVTEDSELAVRIHAQGHRSLYLNTVFGRGLIPESFQDYKKQRFRWTYGPIQELRRHFRLFLPKPLARPSALTTAQKIHHLAHGLGALNWGLELLMLPLGALAITSMYLHGEAIEMPAFLWPALAAAGVAAFGLKWHLFRTAMECSFKDMLGALLAATALDYTIRMASLWGLVTRHTPWRRTNKFKVLPRGLGALGPALHELLLGGGILTAGLGVLGDGHLAAFMRLIGLGWSLQGGRFLTAPLMAVLAEHGVTRRSRLNDAQTAQGISGQPPVQPIGT